MSGVRSELARLTYWNLSSPNEQYLAYEKIDHFWSLGWVSALDFRGRTIWIVDAHGYGKRFIVRADEKLTAFTDLERAKPV